MRKFNSKDSEDLPLIKIGKTQTSEKETKTHNFLKQFWTVFLDILIVVAIFSFIAFGFSYTQKLNKTIIKKQFVGTWKLKDPKESYSFNYINEHYDDDKKEVVKETEVKYVIVDRVLKFTEKEIDAHGSEYNDICYENEKIYERCKEVVATVSLAEERNYVGINFVSDLGDGLTMCFKLETRNTLKQVSCKGIATDEYNPNGFYKNGGIGDTLDITYERVS